MINETAINVVTVLKEVYTGHSLVPALMTILMDAKHISSILDVSNIVYDVER